jgi:hypothetical protein
MFSMDEGNLLGTILAIDFSEKGAPFTLGTIFKDQDEIRW